MSGLNLIWWAAFTVVAVWGEQCLPGVDFLVVGLILSLQEGALAQTCWLLLVWILIHEGAGELAFGSSLLWYAAVFGFIAVGRWLFEAENIVFVALLALVLGVWHGLLVQIMASLQDSSVYLPSLARESLLQALILPPAWYGLRKFRAWWMS